MNQLSSGSLIDNQAEGKSISLAMRPALVWTAWIATLLLSKLPLVIARDLLGTDIPWITPAWIGFAALLFLAAYAWPVLRALQPFFLVMGLIQILALVDPMVRQTPAWLNLFADQPQMVVLFGERVLLALEACIVLSGLFLMGLNWRRMFLAVGNLKASLGGQVSATGRRPLSWIIFGTGMAVLLGGLFYAFLASQNPVGLSAAVAALPWLPLILLGAGLNAFSEEAMYRAAPLGALLPALGPGNALWLTSLWFGLGHYYGGIPSGPVGLVQAGLLGLLLGKAMLDTRGFGWSWIIHVTIDTVIYIFIAAS